MFFFRIQSLWAKHDGNNKASKRSCETSVSSIRDCGENSLLLRARESDEQFENLSVNVYQNSNDSKTDPHFEPDSVSQNRRSGPVQLWLNDNLVEEWSFQDYAIHGF